jgi:hypothetical protein
MYALLFSLLYRFPYCIVFRVVKTKNDGVAIDEPPEGSATGAVDH